MSRIGSALHYLSEPLGKALLAQPGSANPRSRQQALKPLNGYAYFSLFAESASASRARMA
jgi:hypothetical protein